MKKCPAFAVAELLEVNDVALLPEQEIRDRLDDSQGIRAMEGEHKLPAGRRVSGPPRARPSAVGLSSVLIIT